MQWWRRNWRYLLALSVATVGCFTVVLLYALKKRAEANKLADELRILQAGAEVQGLLADKKARAVKLKTNEAESAKLDKEIAAAKRKTVAVIREVSNLSDTDISDAFKRMGY